MKFIVEWYSEIDDSLIKFKICIIKLNICLGIEMIQVAATAYFFYERTTKGAVNCLSSNDKLWGSDMDDK